jgi:hypothetical protein
LIAILNQHQAAYEWTGSFAKCAFAVSSPEINSDANGLFSPVVEVVSERWPYLALEFFPAVTPARSP